MAKGPGVPVTSHIIATSQEQHSLLYRKDGRIASIFKKNIQTGLFKRIDYVSTMFSPISRLPNLSIYKINLVHFR
jgi:hypothetical protein